MSKLVTIYGGSGFLGRQIARLAAKEGWRVRVACRRPNEALFVRTYGAVGQLEPVLCNVRDDASVAQAMEGADAVVFCVGTFDSGGANNFNAVQAEGAGRAARLAAAAGISRFVLISAIGADANSASLYQVSKAAGEAAVRGAIPGAVILRPSVLFGPGDGLFNLFAGMTRFSPILSITGGRTRFQPAYVEDVAAAAVKGIDARTEAGVYELGGPEVETLNRLMARMLNVINRRRLVFNMPFWLASVVATALDVGSALTLRLIPNRLLTRDQVRSLRTDNIVSGHARGFADLGIDPTAMGPVLPEYLWRFRPSGQYDAIKESARNLRRKIGSEG